MAVAGAWLTSTEAWWALPGEEVMHGSLGDPGKCKALLVTALLTPSHVPPVSKRKFSARPSVTFPMALPVPRCSGHPGSLTAPYTCPGHFQHQALLVFLCLESPSFQSLTFSFLPFRSQSRGHVARMAAEETFQDSPSSQLPPITALPHLLLSPYLY